MKTFLLYKDRDFDLGKDLPKNAQTLTQDLELNVMFNAMASDDKFILEIAKKVVFASEHDVDAIRYRQDVLHDCLKNSSLVRDMYELAITAIESEKKHFLSLFSKHPSSLLMRSTDVLQMLVGVLKKLKAIADNYAGAFESEGFTTFFAMLRRELSEDYFARIQNHLRELKFREGVLISAELGQGNKGIDYILRKSQDQQQGWIERIFAEKPPTYTFYIDGRDESGARTLSELKDRGINVVASVLAQSTDHVLSFFVMLRTELAFYLGCVNLSAQLTQKEMPVCFPLAVPANERKHAFRALYDVSLALTMQQNIVGNDMDLNEKDLVIITGANQGGKSTFLRSIGIAQLMMQCGMFVPAESFCANVCMSIFTHYKRREDTSMNSGKLDEELSRMSTIIDTITPNSMLLFNESFAATNDREGSQIAQQIVRGLVERHINVFFVTHLYEFARNFYEQKMVNAVFLRADRQNDGRRTFKLSEQEPLQTSFGEDIYHKIFEK